MGGWNDIDLNINIIVSKKVITQKNINKFIDNNKSNINNVLNNVLNNFNDNDICLNKESLINIFNFEITTEDEWDDITKQIKLTNLSNDMNIYLVCETKTKDVGNDWGCIEIINEKNINKNNKEDNEDNEDNKYFINGICCYADHKEIYQGRYLDISENKVLCFSLLNPGPCILIKEITGNELIKFRINSKSWVYEDSADCNELN